MSEQSLDSQIWKNKFFPDQLNQTEDIILVLREDIIMLVFQALLFVFFFFVATVLKALLGDFFDKLGAFRYLLDVIYHTFNIVLLIGFLLRFHDYYLSVQIITSQRVIDISQNGLFGREVNELQYEKIEDITHKQNGFIATIFNFGDIVVQTAASASLKTSGFVFKNIPNPSKAHKLIMDVYQNQVNSKTTTPVYITQNPQQKQFNHNQIDHNQYIPNPLSPTYRENVLNTSDELDTQK